MHCGTLPELEELIIVSCNKEMGFQFDSVLTLVMRHGSTQVFKFSCVTNHFVSITCSPLFLPHFPHKALLFVIIQ